MERLDTTASVTWFVSRHSGAVAWAKLQQFSVDYWVTHLETSMVKRGDTVIGSLPVHLAAELCARGVIYAHLSLTTPAECRGQEMSAENMQNFDAKVQRFHISPC